MSRAVVSTADYHFASIVFLCFNRFSELLKPFFVFIEPLLLFEIDTEQRGQQWILMIQQPAGVGVFPCVGEQLVKPWLVASTESSTKVLPAVFDSSECIPIRWIRSPHRYRPPGPPAVHASSRGFAAIEVVSPDAVRPVPTASGVDGEVVVGSIPTCAAASCE